MALGFLLITIGAVLFGAFAYLLLDVQVRWFPQPTASGHQFGTLSAKSVVSRPNEMRRFLGFTELGLAVSGVLFLVTGVTMVAMLFGTG